MTGFDKCVEEGGYIETVQKGGGKYQRICTRLKKTFKGKIKKKKNV